MQDIQDIRCKGEEVVALSPDKEVILLLGNTGSGKTTLAQFMVGDPGELVSMEIEEGTGEYIIVDQRSKISYESTILSKTVFPELIIDRKTERVYYDCPGFSDTRSAAQELSATYFIKKVLDSARSVKMIFVVNYHSVRKGVDRKDFILMLNHVVTFINDVDKYKESIALVVTKVENTYRDDGETLKLVSDANVLKSIALFIKDVKNDLIGNPNVINGQAAAVQLLGALLHKVNEDYTKIGLFRRPSKGGCINKIKPFQNEVKNLERIVSESIQYQNVEKAAFGYTISSDAEIYARQLIDKIHKVIVEELAQLGELLKEFFVSQEKKISQLEDLIKKFKQLDETFSDLQKKTSDDVPSVKEYLSNVRTIIGPFNNQGFNEKMSAIAKHEEFIDFLYCLKNNSMKRHMSSVLVKGFEMITNYFKDTLNWYKFLTHLYSRLSQYDVQKDIKKHSANDHVQPTSDSEIDEAREASEDVEGQPTREGSITLVDKIFSDVPQPIIDEVREVFEGIEGIDFNEPKMNMLNKVINLTLKSKEEFYYDDKKLTVKGRFVRLSHVFKEERVNEVNQIEVFALDKVFIDSTFDLTGGEVQLAIVAPVLEVVGSQKITLDGKPGEVHEPPKAEPGRKRLPGLLGGPARFLPGMFDSVIPEREALPGLPGGPAGSFLGVFDRIINEKSLTITAIGGKGGDGQNGADGANGCDAKPEWKGTLKFLLPLVFYNKAEYDIDGKPGQNGSDGAVGGYGGKGGDVTILHFQRAEQEPQLQYDVSDGDRGNEGRGGQGGAGGLDGHYSFVNYLVFFNEDDINYPGERKSYGQNGNPGMIDDGIKHSWQVKYCLDAQGVMNNYLSYLKGNLNGDMKETYLKTFSDTIDSKMKRLNSSVCSSSKIQMPNFSNLEKFFL